MGEDYTGIPSPQYKSSVPGLEAALSVFQVTCSSSWRASFRKRLGEPAWSMGTDWRAGQICVARRQLIAELIRSHPPNRVYAEASAHREETLIIPTQSATVEHEVCTAHTLGQVVPIQLAVP